MENAGQEYEKDFSEELTKEAFYTQWGEQIGLSNQMFKLMWQHSQSLMPELPYHNFNHVQRTLFAAMHLCDEREVKDRAPKFDRRVLVAALLFHDSRFEVDHEQAGYNSKEALSADIFASQAPDYGFTLEEILRGKRYIIATRLGEEPKDHNEKVMVAADIYNTNQTEEIFTQNLELLAQEDRLRKKEQGLDYSFPNFAATSIAALCTYVGNLPPDDTFRMNVTANLVSLARRMAQEQRTSLVRYVYNLGSSTVTKVLDIRLPLRRD